MLVSSAVTLVNQCWSTICQEMTRQMVKLLKCDVADDMYDGFIASFLLVSSARSSTPQLHKVRNRMGIFFGALESHAKFMVAVWSIKIRALKASVQWR